MLLNINIFRCVNIFVKMVDKKCRKMERCSLALVVSENLFDVDFN